MRRPPARVDRPFFKVNETEQKKGGGHTETDKTPNESRLEDRVVGARLAE